MVSQKGQSLCKDWTWAEVQGRSGADTVLSRLEAIKEHGGRLVFESRLLICPGARMKYVWLHGHSRDSFVAIAHDDRILGVGGFEEIVRSRLDRAMSFTRERA